MTGAELMQYLMCAGVTTAPHLLKYSGQAKQAVYKVLRSAMRDQVVQKIGRIFSEEAKKPADVYSFTPVGVSLCKMNWQKLTSVGVLKSLMRSEVMSMNPGSEFVYDRALRWKIMQKHDLEETQFQRHDPLVMIDNDSGEEHAFFTVNSLPTVDKRLQKFSGKMKFHMVSFPNFEDKIQERIDAHFADLKKPRSKFEWADLYKSLTDDEAVLKAQILELVKSIPTDDMGEYGLDGYCNSFDLVVLKSRPFFEVLYQN
jgi:hypothetical protein